MNNSDSTLPSTADNSLADGRADHVAGEAPVAEPTSVQLRPETDGRSRRINPRRRTRSLALDFTIPGGESFHAISLDVSPFGASVIITGTPSPHAIEHIIVGQKVAVRTATAKDLPAEINSLRPVSSDDPRLLVGLKLLDGNRWLAD